MGELTPLFLGDVYSQMFSTIPDMVFRLMATKSGRGMPMVSRSMMYIPVDEPYEMRGIHVVW